MSLVQGGQIGGNIDFMYGTNSGNKGPEPKGDIRHA